MLEDDILACQLDIDFKDWATELTPAQRHALRRWQGVDRLYERIQRILRDEAGDEEDDNLTDTLETIVEAIQAGSLARDVVTWRGVRSTIRSFGRPNSNLAGLVDEDLVQDGLLALSTSKALALKEFTQPPLGGGPALLRVAVPAKTPAAWLPLGGDPKMQYQRELLLGPGHTLHVGKISYLTVDDVSYPEGTLPVLDVEVL